MHQSVGIFSAVNRLSQWRDRIEMLTPPLPWDSPRWHPGEGPPVVLLHGLWRGWRAMSPMARALEQEGFSTLSIPYCSASMPLEKLAKEVRPKIERVAGDQPVHFVTHSLGGILARQLLADGVSWKTGRVVMLAPPNSGSEIVDWSKNHPLFHRVLGPSGRSLGSDGIPCQLPPLPPQIEAAVIMGDRCTIPVFKKLLDSENDGIVSVAKGRIDGLKGFSVIHADHTFIQMHPEAIRLSVNFLKSGEWAAQF